MIDPSQVVTAAEIEAQWSLGHDKIAGREDPNAVVSSPNSALTISNDAFAQTALLGGVGGDQYADLTSQMIRVVDKALVRRRMEALEKALSEWKAKSKKGKIHFQYSDLRELFFDLRSLAYDADVIPTDIDPASGARSFNTTVRSTTLQALARVGMLARFRSLFETQAEIFRGRIVATRPFGADEDIFSVAAGAGTTWLEIVELNSLKWPYTAMVAAPGVLVPGESDIKVPVVAQVAPPTTSTPDRNGGAIGVDFLRDRDTTDLVSLGHGFFSRVSSLASIVQWLTAQFSTVQGFYEEAPDWGAVWLRSGRGVGNFVDDSLIDLFYFHLARMITFGDRLQNPEQIEVRYRAGITRMKFSAKTASGEQISGLEVPI